MGLLDPFVMVAAGCAPTGRLSSAARFLLEITVLKGEEGLEYQSFNFSQGIS